MVRKLLSSKIVFAVVVLAFALAMGVSAAWGNSVNPRMEEIINSGTPSVAIAADPNDQAQPWPSSSGTQMLARGADPNDQAQPWPLSVRDSLSPVDRMQHS